MELHVISNWFKDHPRKREYFEKIADKSTFPIVNFKTKTIKANKLHKHILGFGETFEQKMGLLKKYIGAFVTDEVHSFETERAPAKVIGFKVTPSLAVVPAFMHGWYTRGTRMVLEGCIQHYKPKVVVELGVWYGKSTVGMFQASTHKLKYYGFDFFSSTATQPDYVTMSPMDKLFVSHSRLETAVANVAPYSKKHDIHFLIHDVTDSINVMKRLNVVPDLVFIDAIKNTQDLVKTVNEYRAYNPDIIVVGDDYMVPAVKKAVTHFKGAKTYGEYCYLVTSRDIPDSFPPPVSDFSKYPSLRLSPSERKHVPASMSGYITQD